MTWSPAATSIIVLYGLGSASQAFLFIMISLTEICWCQPGK